MAPLYQNDAVNIGEKLSVCFENKVKLGEKAKGDVNFMFL